MSDSNSEIPSVAVWMLTFNHGKYISRAIEGVLIQQTNFSVRLFIGEDCSTDNTRAVCEEYERKYPERIKLISTPENNIILNAKNIYDACFRSGAKYMAMCEGDDYWTDPYKLQRQVDLLESNPQYSMAFHLGMNSFEETGEQSVQPFYKTEISFEDFASRGCMVHTMSVVFRNLPELNNCIHEEWALRLYGMDLLLFLVMTLRGRKAYCFKEVMGVYRIHGTGMWSSTKYRERANMVIMNNRIYKKHLALSFRQKMVLNWFMKDGLIRILYLNNKGLRYYFNKLINRGIFIFGPGIFSGLMAELFYRLARKKWDLPIYE